VSARFWQEAMLVCLRNQIPVLGSVQEPMFPAQWLRVAFKFQGRALFGPVAPRRSDFGKISSECVVTRAESAAIGPMLRTAGQFCVQPIYRMSLVARRLIKSYPPNGFPCQKSIGF
jgi:hypothetical protein